MPRGGSRGNIDGVVRPVFRFDEYVELEHEAAVKHEFLAGQVWAMAGGSPEHAALAANVTALLIAQLRGKPCRVYSSDLRIRVVATGLATYPDVSVVSGKLELDPEDARGHTALNPKVVVEVLSPSTEEYDRGEKLEHYRRIPSLEEVVLVAQDRSAIEVWRAGANGWSKVEGAGQRVLLDSIGCELVLEDVYRDPLAG
jgi:Uma2 family endonuclease